MHLKFVFIFLLMTCQIQLMAQDDFVQEIKHYYNQIAKEIKICKSIDEIDKMDCGLYRTELIVNSDEIDWGGSGNFSRMIEIWFEGDPKYCDQCGEDGVGVVKKITMDERSALNKYHYEYLYNNGRLIFHYEKQEVVGYDGEEEKMEYRYYLDEIGLGRYIADQKIYNRGEITEEVFEKIEKIQERSSGFLKLFLFSLK